MNKAQRILVAGGLALLLGAAGCSRGQPPAVGGDAGDRGEAGVAVGQVQHVRRLLLVRVAQAGGEGQRFGDVPGAVAVDGEAVGIDRAAGVAEDGVEEVVLHAA